ncbi:MAG: class I SAM-dependent methyltransferase [Bacteriovoracales bacterium]|nr:class I SAM-dependent methyltransferase [Bacteriovoracales bacterium]
MDVFGTASERMELSNRVDFERFYRKALRGPREKNLLAKAFKGLHSDELVVDTCCGLGEDLMRLRALFSRVVGIERNPFLARLLQKAQRHFSLGGVEIIEGEAKAYDGPGRVFYMDPMYPLGPRQKSLAKRPLELLKKICGPDGDQVELLEALLDKKPRRVVVKRPLKARPLLGERVKFTLEGKLIRFDIY